MPFRALFQATSRRAQHNWREHSDRATWGAALRRPKLLCERIFAHSKASVERQLGEGSEGPLRKGLVLPLGPLGHR
eukprot:11060730-Alexandrium_andersonii.AAC.1